MLGLPKPRDLNRPVLIAIELYVPKDHFYRHLHRVLDLSFVRDLAADCYASGGRPSIDPEVFFRTTPDCGNAQMKKAQRQVEDIRCQLAAYQKKAEVSSTSVTSTQVQWFCQTCRTVGSVLR